MYYRRKKKGQFFEIDALIAVTILIVGLIYVKNLRVDQPDVQQNQVYSDEAVKLLRTMKTGEYNASLAEHLKNDEIGAFIDANNSLAKQIATFYIKGNTTLAESMARGALDGLIPIDYGYSVVLISAENESIIYNRTKPASFKNLANAKTMITGLQQTKPIIGKLAKLYLSNLENNLRAYMFFGGYVGQGNISFSINLPADAQITGADFEGYAGSDINVSVNGSFCGTINKTGGTGIDNITIANFQNCQFGPGKNEVVFDFGNVKIVDKYIGGGFFEVVYKNNLQPGNDASPTIRKKLPGIKGIINIYDSLFFDGNVSSLRMNLLFNKSDASLFVFNFGNDTLFSTHSPGIFNISLDEQNLSSSIMNYSNQNVPIRIGAPKGGTGTADIAWITDLSTSMSDCGEIDYRHDLTQVQCNKESGVICIYDSKNICQNINSGICVKGNNSFFPIIASATNGMYSWQSGWANNVTAEFNVHSAPDDEGHFYIIMRTNNLSTFTNNSLIEISKRQHNISISSVFSNNSMRGLIFNRLLGANTSVQNMSDDMHIRIEFRSLNFYLKEIIVSINGLSAIDQIGTQVRIAANNFALVNMTAYFNDFYLDPGNSSICITDFNMSNPIYLKTNAAYAYYSVSGSQAALYKDIGAEKEPNVQDQVTHCSNGDDLCSAAYENQNLINCKNGGTWIQAGNHPDITNCCSDNINLGCCNFLNAAPGTCHIRDMFWAYGRVDEADTFAQPCSPSFWASIPYMGACSTFCQQWDSAKNGTCNNNVSNYYYNINDGNMGSQNPDEPYFASATVGWQNNRKLCIDSTGSALPITLQAFSTNCHNLNSLDDAKPSNPQVTSQTFCNGNCISSGYSKCEIDYSAPTEVTDCSLWTPAMGDHCYQFYSPGETLPHSYVYNLSYKEYPYQYQNCSIPGSRVKWLTYYVQGWINLLKWDTFDYRCANKFYDQPLPPYGKKTGWDAYPGAGFYSTNFTVSKQIDYATLNITQMSYYSTCYLNGKIISDDVYISDQWVSYMINGSDFALGQNNLSCKLLSPIDQGTGLTMSVTVYYKDGTSPDTIFSGDTWPYGIQNSAPSSIFPWCNPINLFDSSCEYAETVSNCSGQPPLMGNAVSLGLVVHNPIPIPYPKYYVPVSVYSLGTPNFFETLHYTFGEGTTNLVEANSSIPGYFFNSSDVLIVDNNNYDQWYSQYKDNIAANVSAGKNIITTEGVFDYITASLGISPTFMSSYGFTSKIDNYGNGRLIAVIGSGDSVQDYVSSNAANTYFKNFLAMHLFSVIFPVWVKSSNAGLTCPYQQYCIPGQQATCTECQYVRSELATDIGKEYTSQLTNIEGNQLNLLSFGTNMTCKNQIDAPTNNQTLIDSTLDSYYPDCGETCTSCAIKRAIDNFANNSNSGPIDAGSFGSLYANLVGWWNMESIIDNPTCNGAVDCNSEYSQSGICLPGCTASPIGTCDAWGITFGCGGITDQNDCNLFSGDGCSWDIGSGICSGTGNCDTNCIASVNSGGCSYCGGSANCHQWDSDSSDCAAYGCTWIQSLKEIADSSGNGNSGIIYGAPSQVNGKYGEGLNLGGNGDFVGFNTLNGIPKNSFSFGGWFRTSKTISSSYADANSDITGKVIKDYAVFPDHGGDSDAGAGLLIGTNGIAVVEHGSSYMPTIATYYSNIGSGWNYVMVIYNNKTPTIYLNGIAVHTGLKSQRDYVFPSRNFGGGAYGYFQGSIDEYVIFNRNLSADEVSKLYNISAAQRQRYIVLMSDGEANYLYNESSGGSYDDPTAAPTQAINYSKLSCTQMNTTLFTVAFGSLEGSDTLKAMAKANKDAGCNGAYFEGTDKDSLDAAFDNIIQLINFNKQGVNHTASLGTDAFSEESYIEYNTTKTTILVPNNTIKFMSQTQRFNGCTSSFNVSLNGFYAIDQAEISSYSGDWWTSKVSLNGENIYDSTKYGNDLLRIGDPYIIGVPTENEQKVMTGTKQYSINIGLLPSTGACSSSDRMMYAGYLQNVFNVYSGIVEKAEGCNWNIAFSDGTAQNITVPSNYGGSNNCSYTPAYHSSVNYQDDAYNIAVFSLLQKLDFDNNGIVDVSVDRNNLQIDAQTVTQIPFLWGPALLEVRVWK